MANQLLLNFAAGLQREKDTLAGFAESEYARAPVGTPTGTAQSQMPAPTAGDPMPHLPLSVQTGTGSGVAPPPMSGQLRTPDGVSMGQPMPPTRGNGGSLPGVAGTVFNTLTREGIPEHIAYGFLGNMQQESGFNPTAWNDQEGAFGLVQWRQDRYQRLQDFAQRSGTSINNPETQAQFVLHELRTTERDAYNRIMQAQTPEEAAALIDQHYERSAGVHTGNRQRYASAFAGGTYSGNGGTLSTKSPEQGNGNAGRVDRFFERVGLGPTADDPDTDQVETTGRQRAANMLEVLSEGFQHLSTGQGMDLSDILQGQASRREIALKRVAERRREREQQEQLQQAQRSLAIMHPEYSDLILSGPVGYQAAVDMIDREDRQAATLEQQEVGFGFESSLQAQSQNWQTRENSVDRSWRSGESAEERDLRIGLQEDNQLFQEALQQRAWEREDVKELDERDRAAIERAEFVQNIEDPDMRAVAESGPVGFNYILGLMADEHGLATEKERLRFATDQAIRQQDAVTDSENEQRERQKEATLRIYGDQVPDAGDLFDAQGAEAVAAEAARRRGFGERMDTVEFLRDLGENDPYYSELARIIAADPALSLKDANEMIQERRPPSELQVFEEYETWDDAKKERFREMSSSGATRIDLGDKLQVAQWESGDTRVQREYQSLDESRAAANVTQAMQALFESVGYDIPQGPIAGNRTLMAVRGALAELGLLDESGENVIAVSDSIQQLKQRMMPQVKLDSQISEKEFTTMMASLPGIDKLPMGNAITLQMLITNRETAEAHAEMMDEYLHKNGNLRGFNAYYNEQVESGNAPSTVLSESEFDQNPTKVLNMVDNGYIEVGDVMMMYNPETGRNEPRAIDEIDIEVWREAAAEDE